MKRKINFALKSWRGTRPVNQDSVACSFNENGDFCAIVCDGIGSISGSEKASKLVTDVFTESFEQTYTFNSPTVWFRDTLNRALKALKALSIKINKPTISTTLALLIIANDKFYTYNIGDTRIYSIQKDGVMKQCSYDHNYRNYLISKGYKGAKLDAYRNKWASLVSFIDASNPKLARFECNSGPLDIASWFIISTDGVYAHIEKDALTNILNKRAPLSYKSFKINKTALQNQSNDNVSNIIVKVK